MVNGPPRKDVDLIHVHTVGPYSAALLISSNAVKVASAHLVPDSLRGSIVGAGAMHRFFRPYLSWLYNHADLVVAVSDYVKVELLGMGVTKPILVVPNWVHAGDVRRPSSTRLAMRSRLGLDPSDVLVVSVGQLQPRKGVLDFLATAAELPKVRFLWVGESIFGVASLDRTELRRALAQASPNVRCAGQVARATVYDYLAAADIYLSLATQETFGIAVLEAASAACPLVLSDLPVFRATYGDAAQYVPAGGAAATLSALAASSALRNEWGFRAAEAASAYQPDPNGDHLLAGYNMLLKTKRRVASSSGLDVRGGRDDA